MWLTFVVGCFVYFFVDFTPQAVAHGTLDWTCTERERRVVMLKYCPGHVAWGREYMASRTPDLIKSLTERQRARASSSFGTIPHATFKPPRRRLLSYSISLTAALHLRL